MFYQKELDFLINTFKKNRVKAAVATESNFITTVFQTVQESYPLNISPESIPAERFFRYMEACTVYKITDPFNRSYIYLLLPETEKISALFIGPYLSSPLSSQDIAEICKLNKVTQKNQRNMAEYYANIPTLPENNALFLMLDAFCELIWKTGVYTTMDVNTERKMTYSVIGKNEATKSDLISDAHDMEDRYAFENELMEAVSLGQIHKEKNFSHTFSTSVFEKRCSDPLRNAKNHCVIFNTLLRKAAEKGGVPPIYIDRISSMFAGKIEGAHATIELDTLMREMFRGYCRAVQQHSLKKFSLLVQKVIMIVDHDLSADLSPGELAKSQNVSAGYLSTIFKKETGKTISEYIREKRIKHAASLISTTKMQIQAIAAQCGIIDVQYFSKIFKKQTGFTPKEYREITKTQKM